MVSITPSLTLQGVRKRGKVHLAVEKFSVIKTLQAIQDANVVLLTIDAREGVSDQDLSLLGFILNAGRSLVIVVNKWDGLNQDIKDQVKSELDRRLDFVISLECILFLLYTVAASATCLIRLKKPMLVRHKK